MAFGAIGRDARGRRPLAKKVRFSPFSIGEGGRGDGDKSYYLGNLIMSIRNGDFSLFDKLIQKIRSEIALNF